MDELSIEELRKRRAELKANSDITLGNMQIIVDESLRVAEVAHHSREILENLDEEFERQTGLKATDVKFLFFATALQMGRWILIKQMNKSISNNISSRRMKDNDPVIKNKEKEARNKFRKKHDIDKDGNWEHRKSEKYPTWLEIVFDGVPFDVSVGSPKFEVNMDAGYHRLHTLGHDPLLGWIFGTMNIISSTITLDDFRTYKISSNPRPKHWESQTNLVESFKMTMESLKEDERRLPAAIFAEAIHLKSDTFTKLGLPIPVLEVFDPELAGKLYKSNYDSLCLLKDIAVVGTQAGGAILINTIISLIHGLYYDPENYGNRDMYEVKTRKILMYSNLISSMSNVIWVGGNSLAGNGAAWKDLDLGGLIVTMYRLVTDTKFIQSVKNEFVFGSFNKMIQGEDLNLKELTLWD